MENGDRQIADREAVAVRPEAVEIRAVTSKIGPGIENVAEDRLDIADMLADRDRTTEPLLKPGRRRKMVGVSMGLEEPVDRYLLRTPIDRKSTRLNSSPSCAPR